MAFFDYVIWSSLLTHFGRFDDVANRVFVNRNVDVLRKGAPDTVVDRCSSVRVGSETVPMNPMLKAEILKNIKTYGTGDQLVSSLIDLSLLFSSSELS